MVPTYMVCLFNMDEDSKSDVKTAVFLPNLNNASDHNDIKKELFLAAKHEAAGNEFPIKLEVVDQEYDIKNEDYMKLEQIPEQLDIKTENVDIRDDKTIVEPTNNKCFGSDVGNCSHKSQSPLERYIKSHSAVNLFVCNKCNFKCVEKSVFTQHMISHSGERPFQCVICNSSYKQKVQLTAHMRKHTGEKPLQCTKCDSKFSQHYQLRLHLKRVHTSEKNMFVCKICNYQYKQQYHLTEHIMKIHTN